MLARILIAAIALFLVIPAPLQVAQEVNARDARRLVDQYLDAKTTLPEREEILGKLKGMNPADATRQLQRPMRDDEQRPRALQLAIALKVPGLFKSVEPHFDTLDQPQVIKWILTLRDADGVKFLFEKWKAIDAENSAWRAIDDSFRSMRLDVASLDLFRGAIDDKKLEDAALEVVRFQLEMHDMTADRARKEWITLRRDFERDFREFEFKGHNLMKLSEAVAIRAVPRGNSLHLEPTGYWLIESMPEKQNNRVLNFVVRVSVLKPGGAFISVSYKDREGKGYGYRVTEGNGRLGRTTEGRPVIGPDVRVGEWHEVKIVATPAGGRWMFKAFVDGRVIHSEDGFGEPEGFSVWAKDGTVVVGGIDLWYGS